MKFLLRQEGPLFIFALTAWSMCEEHTIEQSLCHPHSFTLFACAYCVYTHISQSKSMIFARAIEVLGALNNRRMVSNERVNL